MVGNYPVNDDWIFVRQVEAFNHGILKISAELDPSFLAQGFLGLLWGKIFGFNFLSFQILTLLVTLVGVYYLVKILKLLGIEKKLIVVVSFLYLFNPIIFNSTFSFMTDNYFLTFMLISCFYYFRFFRRGANSNFIIGVIFMFLATLIRQVGIFIGLAFVAAALLKDGAKVEINKRKIIVVLMTVLFGVLISFLWPDYGSNRMFILPEQFMFRFRQWLLSFYYILLFAFPLFFGLRLTKETAYLKILMFITAIAIGLLIYRQGILPLGNVFYLEGLHTKSDFRLNFSLFDNVFFKISLSGLVSLSLVQFLVYRIEDVKTRETKVDGIDIFLLLLFFSNLVILLIASDFYDRYLLPCFSIFVIFFAKNCSNNLKINWKVISSTLLLVIISIFLQWEYSTTTRIKWNQASLISEQTGYFKQIDIDDVYRKYTATVKSQDYTGLVDTNVYDKKCYVQKYTLDTENKLLTNLQNLEAKIGKKFLEKRKPPHVNKKDMPRVKNNYNLFVYNQEYFSPIYNLVGKKAYVGSWCLE